MSFPPPISQLLDRSPRTDFAIQNGFRQLEGADEIFLTTELPAAIAKLKTIIPTVVFSRDHQSTNYDAQGGMSGLIEELSKIHRRCRLLLEEPDFQGRFIQQFDPLLTQLAAAVRTSRINELAPKNMQWGMSSPQLERQTLQEGEQDDNTWLNAFKVYLNLGKLPGGRSPLPQDREAVDLLTQIYHYKKQK